MTGAAHLLSRHGCLDAAAAEEVEFLRQTVDNFATLLYDAAPAEKLVADMLAKLAALAETQHKVH